MSSIRVFLADDHALLRQGLRVLIDSQEDMEVVGEASNGLEAIRQIPEARPQVVVMDVSMPEMGGAEATQVIKRQLPDVRVLALTRHASTSYLKQLLRAGADGYVIKRAAADELIFAIRRVVEGRTYLDPSIAALAVGSLTEHDRVADAEGRHVTEREEQVMRQIAWGYTNKEIAAKLEVSVKTVETHKSNLMQKLGLRSRADVVRYAVRHGWFRQE